MSAKTTDYQPRARRRRGFERASGLMQSRIRIASEKRGFAVARLLTHWEEIVGADTAAIARPVKISYAQGGFGATLTLLTTGAHAPMLQAELPKIKERVNACYGHSAINHIRLTQTAPTGFAEGQASFTHAPKQPKPPRPEDLAAARSLSEGTQDGSLREALERLGQNVLSRSKPSQ